MFVYFKYGFSRMAHIFSGKANKVPNDRADSFAYCPGTGFVTVHEVAVIK
jgi:hypothetical protein